MSGLQREIVIAPQERGWAVITRFHTGQWAGQEIIHYCRWYWQARREFARAERRPLA